MTRREAKKIAHNLAMRAIEFRYGDLESAERLANVSDEDWKLIQTGLREISSGHAKHAAEIPLFKADA